MFDDSSDQNGWATRPLGLHHELQPLSHPAIVFHSGQTRCGTLDSSRAYSKQPQNNHHETTLQRNNRFKSWHTMQQPAIT
jgi:hypothetical protein